MDIKKEPKVGPKKVPEIPLFSDRYRYFILLLSLFCLASISSNMLTFNFAVICMATPKNSTIPRQHSTHDFTQTQISSLIWSVGAGSLIGTFPFSFLYTKYGARYIFLAAGVISIVATALTPLAVSLGLWCFIGVRFLVGLAYSADFAAIGLLCLRWGSLKQQALFISVLTCYSPLSSTITNAASGFICESSFGWPAIYYSHAFVGCVLFSLWAFFYHDDPRKRVSPVELEKIERNKGVEQLALNSVIPYKKIITNPVVLTIWFNAFAEIFSAILLLTYTPLYLRNVHHFTIEATGLLSSLPTLCNMPVRMMLGWMSDKIKFLSERTKLNIFNTYSVFLPGLCYLTIAFLDSEQHILAVVLIVMISLFFAGTAGGFYKCSMLTTLQFSHFIVANIQFIKCITLFLAPLLYAICVHDPSVPEQWRTIFLIITLSHTVAAGLFLWKSTDKPLEFTRVSPPEQRKLSLVPEPNFL